MNIVKEFAKNYDDLFKNKVSKPIFSSLNDKEQALYKLLTKDISEVRIAKTLYSGSPSHQSYQSLKKSFLEKFKAIVFTTVGRNNFQKRKIDVFRDLSVLKILEVLHVKPIIEPLALKLLNKAEKFDMFFEQSEAARILHIYHGGLRNLDKTNEYHELSISALEKHHAELILSKKFLNIQINLLKTEKKEEVKSLIQIFSEEVESLGIRTVKTQYYFHETRFYLHYLKGDLLECIEECQRALQYFNGLTQRNDLVINIFTLHLITINIYINEFAKAELLIKSYLNQIDPKVSQYYRYKETLFRIHMFTCKIKEAKEVYQYLDKNIRRLPNADNKDRLLIYKVYMGIISGDEVNFRKINYNINKAKKDKAGVYIPLLVGTAVYNYIHYPDKFIDKMDALNQYCYKYFNQDKHIRTRQFIKILNRFANNRSYDDIELNLAKGSFNNYGLEVVKYEDLISLMEQVKQGKSVSFV